MFKPVRAFFVFPLYIVVVSLLAGLSASAQAACVDMGYRGEKYIGDFSEDVAVVKEKDNKFFFVTRSGEPLNNQWYEEILAVVADAREAF